MDEEQLRSCNKNANDKTKMKKNVLTLWATLHKADRLRDLQPAMVFKAFKER